MERIFLDYDDFVKKYSKDPEKKESIKEYEKKFHIMRHSVIENHPFYKYHLSKFDFYFDLVTPSSVNMSPREWNLLARLIFGSLSSSFLIKLDEKWKKNPVGRVRAEICVAVSSQGSHLTKQLSDLCGAQIKRLFEIYVNEQIDLFLLWQEEKGNDESCEDMEIEDEDYESWQVKREQKKRYDTFKRQTKYLMADAEFYKKLKEILAE